MAGSSIRSIEGKASQEGVTVMRPVADHQADVLNEPTDRIERFGPPIKAAVVAERDVRLGRGPLRKMQSLLGKGRQAIIAISFQAFDRFVIAGEQERLARADDELLEDDTERL